MLIPADLALPTCVDCGEWVLNRESAPKIDAALESVYEEMKDLVQVTFGIERVGFTTYVTREEGRRLARFVFDVVRGGYEPHEEYEIKKIQDDILKLLANEEIGSGNGLEDRALSVSGDGG